jgi:outer membrane receptor protein involved in Fe transport
LNVPPRHRANFGASAAHGHYFGSLSTGFVDAAFWQDVLPAHQGHTEAYTVVDGAVGVHSADRRMTVTARGSNLLNKRIQEHAFGDVIRRRVTGEIRLRF